MSGQRTMTFGVVVGNRGFFPHHLAKTGREEIIAVLEAAGARAIVLSPEESSYGAVETYAESQRCAELFKKHADAIDGIIVTLPNFGEERGIVDAIRLSGLKVPVLVQATPDRSDNMTIAMRRDSFCGKMSACNNMMQYGIQYSLTTLHTEALNSPEFKADLEWFSAVCRIVKGLKNLRIGAIGARPTAFNTVRYSERIFETSGITIETLDLSEIFGRINRMKDTDDAAQAKLAAIKKYVTTAGIADAALLKMAKLGAVIDGWMKQAHVTISAVQCWTSMEEFFGVVPCTIMSMMSDNLIPSACETDVPGTLSMYMLALASGTPSALLDWNNNYGSRSEQVRLLPLLQSAQALLQGRADGLPGDYRRHGGQGKHVRHLRGPGEGGHDVLRALLDRRPAGDRYAATRAWVALPTIRWKPSEARAWRRSRSCRSCSDSFAAKASNIT